MCVKQWLTESVCTCISVSQRPEAVSHIQQGPVLITWLNQQSQVGKKTTLVLSNALPTEYDSNSV